ncbi:nucleoside triphosphatase [Candidatus Nitromaritima sp. SCGC AAA799-A02]|nr:nucleoside triphosphatase [Candidatus Nitromaritima sp. SCGC AAA799-C22]KMP12620.1 nucleoside triphosphatase [Candidatus Nitromaritima sp. SCGC AAA799-A02]
MEKETFWNQLKFVTGNADKVREASEILGHPLQQAAAALVYEMQTNDSTELVMHKAKQAYDELKCPVLVEDSGLLFEAWNGLPGALIKWFEISVGCDGILKMLDGFDNREAAAVCITAVFDGREFRMGRGEVKGTVAESLRGENGFGWDVLFIPDGHDRTYAEMSPEEKNEISHRRRAFEQLKKYL